MYVCMYVCTYVCTYKQHNTYASVYVCMRTSILGDPSLLLRVIKVRRWDIRPGDRHVECPVHQQADVVVAHFVDGTTCAVMPQSKKHNNNTTHKHSQGRTCE